ncbi:unnamed protein product [Cylicocyclus nassatus]|uniref:Uncharacterized protein n=1 Tax=Cylicocyclus nassatus TaxID=53992 RepID=A0AA36MDZ3_CYLNA|nr:unnamed protein product [Cylicocyclus nassatus]
MQAGDMAVKGSSDELAMEMQLREEKTYQTADESKREITVALKIWKQTLEAENKRLNEVLPVVQRRYDELVKQRDALVEKVNKLRESIGMAAYVTEEELKALDADVKTANSFSMESFSQNSETSSCTSLPSLHVEDHCG